MAAIAMLIAIKESPPRSKKLALRSTELTPRHCDQMLQRNLGLRLSVAGCIDGGGRGAIRGAGRW